MTKQRKFIGTKLDNKILRNSDFEKAYASNFSELCKFFNLDEKELLKATNNPWQVLCTHLMEHLIPGFQKSDSGRPSTHTKEMDEEIRFHVEVMNEFEDLSINLKKTTTKDSIERIAKHRKLSKGSIKAARDRAIKLKKSENTKK